MLLKVHFSKTCHVVTANFRPASTDLLGKVFFPIYSFISHILHIYASIHVLFTLFPFCVIHSSFSPILFLFLLPFSVPYLVYMFLVL